MERHPEWSNVFAVMDWTGSMYVYGAQLLRWHNKQVARKTLHQLALFNDGDDYLYPQNYRREKPLGAAGGVYFCNPNDIHEVIETMNVVMQNGDGGDKPENNIEALLASLKRIRKDSVPDVQLVMIADNHAPVRDMELLPELVQASQNPTPIPVHIIVCGANGTEVHPDYITLAWKTSGSVILLEEELAFDQAEKPLAGGSIQFAGSRYILSPEGRFSLAQ
jgi:hypothetical protein